ncbi:acetyltransferase EpsM [Evansella vedderi]|uniref:Acetyltransferase EpsM n=1 Tax=Evansella vedderi TaxID=38282 RepID=A0ABT9ZZB8_9BACI|nr:acetyltransferase [Evansella vedderi]MDQ0256573.1 acetyltransferase EpsM [Evansella vedderi]
MKIVIIGKGGHSKVISDIVQSDPQIEIIGYLDDKYNDFFSKGDLYYGPINSAKRLIHIMPDVKFIIAIGNNLVREQIAKILNLNNCGYASLVHKNAMISSSAQIGQGTVVMANAVINADSKIGNHSIINTSAVVEHDNVIGDFVHISPNVTLTGGVHIKDGAHVGAGATIIPGIEVGERSIIGAGATVIHHIPPHCTAVGIPALVKKKVGELIANND